MVIEEKCTGCRSCLKLGCPAIEWVPLTPEEAKKLGYKETQKGHSNINTAHVRRLRPVRASLQIQGDRSGRRKGRMDKIMNLFLCGVGGQGILLASEIISSACMKAGFDVKQSEVHGMAQRGGSVISHIRFGEKVYSPLIELGDCRLRGLLRDARGPTLSAVYEQRYKGIVNTQKILPSPVATGMDTYPADVLDQFKSRDCRSSRSMPLRSQRRSARPGPPIW